jgi:hypothetical protein
MTSNTLNDHSVPSSPTTYMTGCSSGSVIERKIWSELAPSTRAAS